MEDSHPPPLVKGGIPFPRTHFGVGARGPTLQPAMEEAENHVIVYSREFNHPHVVMLNRNLIYSRLICLISWVWIQMSNYALTMHLKHANQSSSIPGRFHPDVF